MSWRIAAVLELFALAGSLACGVLADKYSRRTTFVAACGKHMSPMECRDAYWLIHRSICIKHPISRFLRRVGFAVRRP